MLNVKIARGSHIIRQISQFYLNIWHDRLHAKTLRKYTRLDALNNIRAALEVLSTDFDDSDIKHTIITKWRRNGWYELRFRHWHFAVTVQLDMFGYNTAWIHDCLHDKDYHNDIMQTLPFIDDSPNDKSHLVDWRLRLNTIINEEVNKLIRCSLQ